MLPKPQIALPIRAKPTEGHPSIASIEKVQKAVLDAVGKTRATAQESAKRGVGPRGPVPAGKGLTAAEKKKMRKVSHHRNATRIRASGPNLAAQ